MKVVTCSSFNEAAQKTSDFLRSVIGNEQKSRLQIFLPTGRTPRPLYGLMTAAKDFWGARLSPIQIDEFVDPKRLFYEELRENLLKPLGLEKKGSYLDPAWSDAEMKSHMISVVSKGVDVALLGIGPNGHVGFHEPGCPPDFAGGRLRVTEETRKRVLGAETTEVLTFGVGSFLKARHIILLVTGPDKQTIFREFMTSKPTEKIPATLLKAHNDLTVITDLK